MPEAETNALRRNENSLLFEQNNERTVRKSVKATVAGNVRVMSYEDIVEAQKQRDMKEAAAKATKSRRRSKGGTSAQVRGKRSRGQEIEDADHEIRTSGLSGYCSVLEFYIDFKNELLLLYGTVSKIPLLTFRYLLIAHPLLTAWSKKWMMTYISVTGRNLGLCFVIKS